LIGDEQLMYPNKLLVWTKNTAALCEGGGIREERNRTPLIVTCGGQVTRGVLW